MLAEVSCTPASDHPGWMEWTIGSERQFNRYIFQRLLSRMDDASTARLRILPMPEHENVNGVLHGGAILALIDMAIYPATILITGNEDMNAVTVDLHTQFISPGNLTQPLDAVITLTQETGRMCFTRGTLVQGDTIVATFNALQRKIR